MFLSARPALAGPSAEQTIMVDQGRVEINAEVYPSNGSRLLIWQPHEIGLQDVDRELARDLSASGIEVWLVDLAQAHFLPNTESSLAQVPAEDVQAVLTTALSLTDKRVYVGGSGRGALPVLRGVRAWQHLDQPQARFGGIILLSPKLFVETPDPGLAAELMPIVRATNAPLFILQPNKSPWIWKMDKVLPALESGGSDIYKQALRDVRDRFYFRPDATAREQALSGQLPTLLSTAMQALDSIPPRVRRAVTLAEQPPAVMQGKKERALKPYQGDPVPPPLQLPTLNGETLSLADYKGQVVLVNFWASWCPPCVHEMPSMQRLADHFRDQPFAILAVNMAEDEATIREFLVKRVSVEFPILLDRDGQALKRWEVFAFPTSYVLDKQGRIRYALFGGIEWDQKDIIDKLQTLISE